MPHAIMRTLTILVTAGLLAASSAKGQVTVERVSYFGQANCYRLTNGTVEVIVTTDIGPRIIRYGFVGAENQLAEMPEPEVKTEMGTWKPYGGHRLWIAPESKRQSYGPDNEPVPFELLRNGIRLMQKVEPKTGVQKTMIVTLDAVGTGVTIVHQLTNTNLYALDIAPWALTIVMGGGQTIIPQEPFISHDDYVLPARPMVLWHYTDLTDPRWTLGRGFLRLRSDAARPEPQKIGVLNKQGWMAHLHGKTLFVKRFAYNPEAQYPDYNTNCQTYTAGTFMEVETVGHLRRLLHEQTAEHVERWYLFANVDAGPTEATLAAAVQPLIAQTQPVK